MALGFQKQKRPQMRFPAGEPRPFFRAALRNDGVYELLVYEEIGENWWDDGGITAKSFKQELDKANGPYSRIVLRINSPGGDAFEGVAILNMLRAQGKPIDVYVDGMAASAASIVAMAGDTITMGSGAVMMVHNAYSMAIGNAEELQKQVNALNAIDESIAQTYVERTGMKKAEVLDLMKAETWMTASECIKNGFATAKVAKRGASTPEGIEPIALARRFKALGHFRNVPAQFKEGTIRADDDPQDCLCACVACKTDDCQNCTDTSCNDKNCQDCPMQEDRQNAAAKTARADETALHFAVARMRYLNGERSGIDLTREDDIELPEGARAFALRRCGSAILCFAANAQGKVTAPSVPRVSGLLAPYDSLSADLGGFQEAYQPGCFTKWLAVDDPRVCFNHESRDLLGRKSAGTARFWEAADGLHYEADLPDTQAGKDVHVLLKRGDLTESSAAFWIYQARWEQRGEIRVRVIEEARLLEGSPHTFGAYAAATARPEEAEAMPDYESEQIADRLRLLSIA